MIKKHSVLIGIFISLVLLLTAISIYPGGTYQDKNPVGFDWTKNYISNLFEACMSSKKVDSLVVEGFVV